MGESEYAPLEGATHVDNFVGQCHIPDMNGPRPSGTRIAMLRCVLRPAFKCRAFPPSPAPLRLHIMRDFFACSKKKYFVWLFVRVSPACVWRSGLQLIPQNKIKKRVNFMGNLRLGLPWPTLPVNNSVALSHVI